MSGGNGRLGTLVPPLLATLLAAWLLGLPGEMQWWSDAREYARFARAILSGEVFRLRGEEIEPALAIRTPGYPILLAGGMLVTAGDDSAVRLVHVGVAVATLLGVPLLLAGACSPWITAPSVLLVQLQMRSFYPRPITEWVAVHLLLWLFALAIRYGDLPRLRRLLWVGLLASACVLTRPALIVVLPLPLALAWLVPAESRLRSTALALLTLLPLLVWMGFNQLRLGTFNLTPFGGMNVFGVASLIADAGINEDDDVRQASFIGYVNQHRVPVPSLEVPPSDRAPAEVYEACRRAYNTNIHEIAVPYAEEKGVRSVELNQAMLTYAVRVLRHHPGVYARYVLLGLRSLWQLLPLLPLVVVLPLFWLARGQNRGLALASLGFVAIHVGHIFLCAAIEVVIWRYWMLTFAPLVGASVIIAGLVASSAVPSFWRRLRGLGAS